MSRLYHFGLHLCYGSTSYVALWVTFVSRLKRSVSCQVVTDAAEVRVLHAAAGLPGAPEEGTVAAGNKLFLVGHERVSVPFKYVSVDPSNHTPGALTGGGGEDFHSAALRPKTITVTARISQKNHKKRARMSQCCAGVADARGRGPGGQCAGVDDVSMTCR